MRFFEVIEDIFEQRGPEEAELANVRHLPMTMSGLRKIRNKIHFVIQKIFNRFAVSNLFEF